MVPSYFVLPIEEVGKDDQRAENSRRGDQMQTARFPPSQVTTGDSSEFPITQRRLPMPSGFPPFT